MMELPTIWVYHLWCLILFTISSPQDMVSGTASAPDWRIVTYEDLHVMASTRLFERNGLTDYDRFALDVSTDQIIVGVRDNLLRLRLSDLSLVETLLWPSDGVTKLVCLSKGQTKEDCHNFIRVLILRQDRLFVCGTNSYAPQCSWRKLESLSVVESWVTGVAKCPYSPRQNSTSVMTADGNFYSATVTDFTGRDAAVYRMMGPSRHLRTAQYNSRWLNEPDFVSSYDIGDYVYFFFREVAVEYINCGKVIYSRVARICKSDSGGKVLLEDNWTTFLKARLNCSLPGNYPFYFNELQSTYYDEDLQLIFAVFTTSPTSIYGSAVCIYDLTSFDQVFAGSFKYQDNAQAAWTRASNKVSSVQCPRGGKRSPDNIVTSHRHLVDVQKFQMMDSAVQPSSHIPPLLAENERWTHIVADRVRVVFRSVRTEVIVLFVATLEGIIKKFFFLPQPMEFNGANVSACFLEELHLMPSDQPQSIRQLELIRSKSFLLVGTLTRLYQLPTQRCHRFSSKLLCQTMQDPYCEWNDEINECEATGNRHLSSCPTHLQLPVDGDWSSWSPWQPCSSPATLRVPADRVEGNEEDDGAQCLCRSRSCDSPPPSNGGAFCAGRAMQVVNCTHRGMSTKAMEKLREDEEEEEEAEIGGDWSGWSEWTTCSSICGDGQQTRVRSCQKKQSKLKKKNRCLGARKEMRVCNVQKCSEALRVTDWSRWYVTDPSTEVFREERLRCSCKSALPDVSQEVRFEMDGRFCSHTTRNCTENAISNVSCAGDKCEKVPAVVKKEENVIAKDDSVIFFKSAGRVQPMPPKTMNRRLTTRSSFPRRTFAGYCGCRDLGLFRICYRCSPP